MSGYKVTNAAVLPTVIEPTVLNNASTTFNASSTSQINPVTEFSEASHLRYRYGLSGGVIDSYSAEDTSGLYAIHTLPITGLLEDTEYTIWAQSSDDGINWYDVAGPFTVSTSAAVNRPIATSTILSGLADIITNVYPAKGVYQTEESGIEKALFNNNSDHSYQPYHLYSNVTAWNFDGSIANIGDKLYNAAGTIVGGTGIGNAMRFSRTVNEFLGFANNSTVLLRKNSTTGSTIESVKDLSAHGFSGSMTMGAIEGNLSDDDNYVPVTDSNSIGLYDIANDRLVGGLISKPTGYNWHSVTPDGAWMLVQQDDGGSWRRLWKQAVNTNGTLGTPILLTNMGEHWCHVEMEDGEQYVALMQNPMWGISVDSGNHVKFNAGYSAGHLSRASEVPGMFAISAYGNSGDDIGFGRIEIDTAIAPTAVNLTGLTDSRDYGTADTLSYSQYTNLTDVWERWGHSKAVYGSSTDGANSDYERSSFVNTSNDGKKVLVRTNWNDNGLIASAVMTAENL